MENNETKTASLWTAIKVFFANDIENSKEFQEELAEIEKVQKQVHAEKKEFGASLRVRKTQKGKVMKREKEIKEKDIEREE